MKPVHAWIAPAMMFVFASSVLVQTVFTVASTPTTTAYAFDTAAPVGTVYLIQMMGVSAGGSMRVSYGVPITSPFSDIRVAGTGDYAGRVEIDTAASNRSTGLLVAIMPSDTAEGQISVSGVKVSLVDTLRTSLAASVFPVSTPPGGTTHLKVQPGSLSEVAESGWAIVGTSDGLLRGVSTLELAGTGNLAAVAGILASPPVAAATIPVDNDGSLNKYTGFALANINNSSISVRIIILDTDGSVAQTIRPDELNPLGARKQVARFLHEYVPSLLGFKGSMVLVADGGKGFVATALLQKQGKFTAIPVIAGKPASLPD